MKKAFKVLIVIVVLVGIGGYINSNGSKSDEQGNLTVASVDNDDIDVDTEATTKEKETKKKKPNKQEATKEETTKEQAEEDSNEIRPDFKAAMDSYEEFYNSYVDIFKKYKENPADLTLIADYTDCLNKLSDVDAKFAEWETEDLNNAELQYYIDVNARVQKKMTELM